LLYLSKLVGYGDVKIFTNFGRLTCIFAAIWGFFIYSLFVISMNVLAKFDDNGAPTYKKLDKHDGRFKLKGSAQSTIANFILFNHYLRKKQKLIDHTKT